MTDVHGIRRTAERSTVVVTGASGFLGRHVCAHLVQQGQTVRALLRSPVAGLAGTESFAYSGLDDQPRIARALEGAHSIIHLAARVHDHLAKQRGSYGDINARATARLARAAVEHGLREFLFASSVKVMGESTDVPWKESDPPDPVDEYGSSKLDAEMALAEATAASGLNTVALRLPLVYGPGMRANMLRLFRLVDHGYPLPFAAVDNARSILYVGNAAAVFQRMLGRIEGHRVLFVADATPLSTPRLIEEIARVLNKPARLFAFPVPLLEAAASMSLGGVSPALRRLVGSLTVDTRLLQQLVGALPFQTGEGLASTASWYLSARRS